MLKVQLQSTISAHQSARHFVVAHSHGGNVALFALQEEEIQKRIDGLICLSTPFLQVRARRLGPDGIGHVQLSTLIYSFALSLMLTKRLFSPIGGSWRWVVFFPLLLILLAGFTVLFIRAGESSTRMLRAQAVLPLSTRFLVVRTSADEASAGLATFQFASWLLTHGWARVSALIRQTAAMVVGLLRRTSVWLGFYWIDMRFGFGIRTNWSSAYRLVPSSILVMGVSALLMSAAERYWVSCAWLETGLIALRPLMLLFAVLSAYRFYEVVTRSSFRSYLLAGFAGYLVAPAMVPFSIACAILMLPFGFDLALCSLFIEVSAESTPPGTCEVFRPDPDPTREPIDDRSSLGLTHSQSYDDERILERIVGWVQE